MGRLIDADKLKDTLEYLILCNVSENETEPTKEDHLNEWIQTVIDRTPTVQAIPKDQYEARLKADIVAMLTEIQSEIEEVPKYCMTHDSVCVYRKAEDYISDINKLIQQKINALEGNEDDNC